MIKQQGHNVSKNLTLQKKIGVVTYNFMKSVEIQLENIMITELYHFDIMFVQVPFLKGTKK